MPDRKKQPNILVIWGDDIGWQNVSAYGTGTMGYTTPNIDRIGLEGIRFTDQYAQPSCTAGRAAFITGQYPIRSGHDDGRRARGQPRLAGGLPLPGRGDEERGIPHRSVRKKSPRRSQ